MNEGRSGKWEAQERKTRELDGREGGCGNTAKKNPTLTVRRKRK